MKYLFLFSLIVSLFCSCLSKKKYVEVSKISKEYVITGKLPIDGFDGRYTYLCEMNYEMSDFIPIDSTRIEGDQFVFKGIVPDSIKGHYIHVAGLKEYKINRQNLLLVLEEGNINVEFDKDYKATISGTPLNDSIQGVAHAKKMTVQYVENNKDTILAIMDRKGRADDYPIEFKQLKNIQNARVFNLLNLVKGTSLFDELAMTERRYLSEEQNESLIPALSKRMYDKFVVDSIADRNEGNAIVGKPYIESKCLDINGKEVMLSDYIGKGKVVLVDFWASWCGPCIKEIPTLKNIYPKYKDKGLEIINISIDGDKEAWHIAMEKQKMDWPQLLTTRGKESVNVIYGIRSIPYKMLIDKEGIVVSKNILPHEIEEEIKKLLE